MGTFKKTDCLVVGGLPGLIGGAVAGGIIGKALGGLIGAVFGVFAGGAIGFIAGLALCALLHSLLGGKTGAPKPAVRFKQPEITNVALKAPSPVSKNAPCLIQLSFNIDGNDDNAVCEVKYEITAEAANPETSKLQPALTSSAQSFGSAGTFTTQWPAPHDAREVKGSIEVLATHGGQSVTLKRAALPVKVLILP